MKRFEIIQSMIEKLFYEVENLGHVTVSQPELDYVMSVIDDWYVSDHNDYKEIDWTSLIRLMSNHMEFLKDNSYEMEVRLIQKWMNRHND